jgi:hypothetical protein
MKHCLWWGGWLLLLLVGCQTADEQSSTDGALSTAVPTIASLAIDQDGGKPSASATEVSVVLQEVTVNIDQEGITAVVRGLANETCLSFDSLSQERNNANVDVLITAVRNAMTPCPTPQNELSYPFVARIPLATVGWPDGFYVLTINDRISTAFPYQASMLSGGGMQAPAQEAFIEIEGRVWHDLCTGAGDERCANGRGNGVYAESEPGIGQVTISLNRDQCPGSGTLLTTRTQADGTFRFAGLVPGTYCVAITAVQAGNRALLQPGVWTASPEYLSDATVYVNVSQDASDLNFGWDYDLLPRTVAEGQCINQALLVEHLNYGGGVTLLPGQGVRKGWRVLNSGTCTWTTAYSVVGTAGGAIPLPQRVLPGESTEIEAPLIAPQTPGNYVVRWVLQDGEGERFGIGITGNGALTAEMLVPAPTRVPQPTAVLTDTVPAEPANESESTEG